MDIALQMQVQRAVTHTNPASAPELTSQVSTTGIPVAAPASLSFRDKMAKFFDHEFFTGGKRPTFTVVSHLMGLKGAKDMLTQPREQGGSYAQRGLGLGLLSLSGTGIAADVQTVRAMDRLALAQQARDKVGSALAEKAFERAQNWR